MVAVGDTVIWLVMVDVMGTWLVESLSAPVGAPIASVVGDTELVDEAELPAPVADTSGGEVLTPLSVGEDTELVDRVEAPASVEDTSEGEMPAVSLAGETEPVDEVEALTPV
jgi:hypothetical protein